MKILLVDDDISSVTALMNLLEHDHVLKIASNGCDGLEQFDKNFYNVVVTDIMMPKMNGIQLLKEIRDRNKDTYVIVLSGYLTAHNIKTAEAYNPYAFFSKPLDVERFMNVIEEIKNELSADHVK
ncbi:response regulator [bacterium]|nr:response regulator [bacterium]